MVSFFFLEYFSNPKSESGSNGAEPEKAESKQPERRFEAQEKYVADQIVASHSTGSAYEPAAVTQMKHMAAKKAVEHAVDNNNPFAD